MYPFVARWPIQYTSALATGEGLAGVVVAIIAAAQNAGTTNKLTQKAAFPFFSSSSMRIQRANSCNSG
jgi:hypothetical protein